MELPQSGLTKQLMDQYLAGSPTRIKQCEAANAPFSTTRTGRGWIGPVRELEGGVKEQTFLTPAFTLGSGEIRNDWQTLNWPQGHIFVNGFMANVRKRAPNVMELVPNEYPSLVDADFEEVYMHHFTVNKWQISGQKEFERLVEKGEAFHGTAIDLITKEAGISALHLIPTYWKIGAPLVPTGSRALTPCVPHVRALHSLGKLWPVRQPVSARLQRRRQREAGQA